MADFVSFEAVEEPVVEYKLPIFDSPIDISNWSAGIHKNTGIPIAKRNNFTIMTNDNPGKSSIELVQNNYTEPINDNTTSYPNLQNLNSNLSGNKKKAMDYFIGKGLQPYQAAGLVGNLMQESSLNHSIVNKSSGAFGLAQWLGDRKRALHKKYGLHPTFDQQLDFIWEELNTTEKRAFNNLLASKSFEEATRSVMNDFERPSKKEKDESIAKRLKNAQELLS